MSFRDQRPPEIADVVALACALDRDEQQSPSELLQRDKPFAVEVSVEGEDRVAVALRWLEFIKDEVHEVGDLHRRAETANYLTSFFIVVAAILLGGGATLGAFYFDGSGRVNAVSVLAVLVALPGLFLFAFGFAALPSRITRRVPGAGLWSALGRALSPGRLAPLLWRLFPRDLRDSLALVSGRLGRHQQLYASLQKWAILRWSQLFALSFQLTAVAGCLVLVVFTDLAFGWSTTLTTGDAAGDAQRLHRMTSVMALPWSWVWAEAQPSLALIGESRYFRAAATTLSPGDAARLGGWWQFVVLTMVCYGILPRVLTFAWAQGRLSSAARAAVAASPGTSVVMRRLHRSRLETEAIEPEHGEVSQAARVPSTSSKHSVPGDDTDHIRVVINWSEVPIEVDALQAIFPQAKLHAAGGALSVMEELRLAQKLGESLGEADGTILIVVKGWEPPLMEFMDFVTSLRGALTKSPSATLVVLPVGLGDEGALPAATPAQVELWRKKLAGLGDARLRVATQLEEVLA